MCISASKEFSDSNTNSLVINYHLSYIIIHNVNVIKVCNAVPIYSLILIFGEIKLFARVQYY